MDFDTVWDRVKTLQMNSLSVVRCSLDESPSSSKSIRLPRALVDRALENFCEIEKQINGIWHSETANPIDIPDKPTHGFYKTFALQFNGAYFFKNLLKCLIVNEILRCHIGHIDEFVDLGSGAGPFSVALAQSFQSSKLELVDRSDVQLQIADRVFKKFDSKVEVSFSNMNIGNFNAKGKNCVASYAMGESMQDQVDIFRLIRESKTFTLIDSPIVVRGVYDYLDLCSRSSMSGCVSFTAENILKQLIEGGGGHFCFLHKGSNMNSKQLG